MTTTTKYRICFPPESYINTLVPTKAVCSTHLLEKDREKKAKVKLKKESERERERRQKEALEQVKW